MVKAKGGAEPRPRTWGELVRHLCQQLRQKELHQDLVLFLSTHGHKDRALDSTRPGGLEECITAARAFLRQNPQYQNPVPSIARSRRARAPKALFPAHDESRAALLSRLVADRLRAHPDVTSFRTAVWQGTPLSPDAAHRVLESEANRRLSRFALKACDIPVAGHDAKFDTDATSTDPSRQILRVVWAGRPDGARLEIDRMLAPRHVRTALVPGRDGHAREIRVLDGSLVAEAADLAARLSRHSPWSADETLWFLLTDAVPTMTPIRVEVEASTDGITPDGRITLVIEPWVSPRTVEHVYRQIQTTDFDRRRKPPSPRALAAYRFISDLPDSAPQLWAERMRLWNHSGLGKRYADAHHFRAEFRRTKSWLERNVLHPTYRLLISPPTRPSRGVPGETSSTSKRRASSSAKVRARAHR